MKRSDPIGIFDSGIGGLTVAHSIHQVLPSERIIYFGDTAHLPYGDKAPASIVEYSKRITSFLLEKGCKIIVIACNTASSIATESVKTVAGNIPVVNVIDPVVTEVAQNSEYNSIGVIGTKATIQSNEYEKRLKKINPNLTVKSMATPLLVPFIEDHLMDEEIGKLILSKYLSQPQLSGIEALILGCTHYPLLKKMVEDYYDNQVKVFDSANIVGAFVKDYLIEQNLNAEELSDNHHFYVSDFTESFEHNTRNFFSEEVHLEEIDLWRSLKPG